MLRSVRSAATCALHEVLTFYKALLHFIRQLGFSGYIWNSDTILSSSRCFTLKKLRQQLSRHSVLNWTLEEGEKDFMEEDGLAGWLPGSKE